MSKAKAIIREFQKRTGQLIGWSVGFTLLSQFLATLAIPGLELYLDQVVHPSTLVWQIVIAIHIIFGLYALLSSGLIDFILQNAKLDIILEEIETKESLYNNELLKTKSAESWILALVKQSVEIQGTLSILQTILETYQKIDVKDRKPDPKDVGRILAPLIQNRAEMMEFKHSEKYNFAVYLFDNKNRNLYLFYRECDNRIVRHDRLWYPGVGHVGIAFAQKRTIISPDINTSADRDILGENSMVGEDNEIYVSFISTPIFDSVDHNNDPLGVLVITSDRPSHLRQEYKIVVETFAILLGIYFSNIFN